jgi:sialidase-1
MTKKFVLVIGLFCTSCFLQAASPLFEKQVIFKRPTSADHYRGAQIERLSNGRLIAKATLKVGHMRDTGGVDEQHYKYSDDNGKTWHDADNLGMPTVIDRQTGNAFDIYHHWPMKDAEGKAMTEEWMINNPRKGIDIGSFMRIAVSANNCKTWNHKDVTEQFFIKPGSGLAWFIGRGIQLEKGQYAGRLIIPGRYFGEKWERMGPNAKNTLIYSDDHGQSWHWGGSAQGHTGEACVVELSDGGVYMSNRNHDPKTQGWRSYSISRDGGATFTEFGVADELPEPKCHASMVRYSFPDAEKNIPGRVLFLNPSLSVSGGGIAPQEGRKNLTIKMSYDDCKTWPVSKTIHAGKGGYSDMVLGTDGVVMCVFECGEDIYAEDIMLVRFNIEWLESGFVPRMN